MRGGGALISSGLEVHCVGDQAWELRVEWGPRGERLHHSSKGGGEYWGGGWTPGPGESSPQPPGVEKGHCLTMTSRLPSESTGTGDDKYGGFKASAPNVPHLGLPRGPRPPPSPSAAEADRAQFKPKLLVRLAKIGGGHVPQGQEPHSGRAELQEGFGLSLPELAVGRHRRGVRWGGGERGLPSLPGQPLPLSLTWQPS